MSDGSGQSVMITCSDLDERGLPPFFPPARIGCPWPFVAVNGRVRPESPPAYGPRPDNLGGDIRLFEHRHRVGFPTGTGPSGTGRMTPGAFARSACTEHTTGVVTTVHPVESNRQRPAAPSRAQETQRPSRQGLMGRERPSQGVLRKCELRNATVPDPGSKKGGSLPSTSDFPVRARRTREYGCNCLSEKEIGEIARVSRKVPAM